MFPGQPGGGRESLPYSINGKPQKNKTKQQQKKLGMVVCFCDPREGRKLKMRGSVSIPAQAKKSKAFLQSDQSQKDWRCGSSGRVTA
jgi:hypothetical protein